MSYLTDKKDVAFSKEEEEQIRQIISEADDIEIEIDHGIRSVWFHDSQWETELRLLFLWDYKLTISRVAFKNRRQGTMSKILLVLKDFCKKHNIKDLCVQSAETEAMVSFCNRNGFSPSSSSTSMLSNGLLIGDYDLMLFDD